MNDKIFELTKLRSPADLASSVKECKDWVSQNDLKNGLQRKNKDYKFLMDEVLPLSNFCNQVLDESYAIEPVDGNQGYDARVYKSGVFQFNIEIAYPQDGEKRAEKSRELIANGISRLRISSPSDLEVLIGKIKKTCLNKSLKDYSDAWLVFNIVTGAVFESQYAEFLPAMKKVQSIVEEFDFNAQSVYLYFSPFKVCVELSKQDQ